VDLWSASGTIHPPSPIPCSPVYPSPGDESNESEAPISREEIVRISRDRRPFGLIIIRGCSGLFPGCSGCYMTSRGNPRTTRRRAGRRPSVRARPSCPKARRKGRGSLWVPHASASSRRAGTERCSIHLSSRPSRPPAHKKTAGLGIRRNSRGPALTTAHDPRFIRRTPNPAEETAESAPTVRRPGSSYPANRGRDFGPGRLYSQSRRTPWRDRHNASYGILGRSSRAEAKLRVQREREPGRIIPNRERRTAAL